MKRIAAFLLAVLFLALPVSSLSEPVSDGFRPAEPSVFTLAPRSSEGVTVQENHEGSMSILAHVEDDMLVFDETKDLYTEVIFGEGWLACDKYSHFFPEDERAYTLNPDPGVYEYVFLAREGERVALSEWESVVFNASASELPKLYIDAAVDFADIDRETWVDANYRLTLGTKQFESGEFEGTGSVKGRGNSSWGYAKKPYSIKLSGKASLLDIPKTKKYAIIPSYWDGSLMRNYITYKIWQGLVGIDYVPKCEFVDVYLNGEYNGIYLLTERIDVEKNKIDIEEADAENMTGGYLIEKDVNGRIDFDEDLWFNCPYWANQAKDYFVMKAPEPDDAELARAMRDYLEDYMQDIHDCIIGENGVNYLDYVDTDSWVDFIIVQEIAKNIDGNMKTSCWMYKDRDDDHLYMTAPWDFDFAYGLISWNNQSEAHNDVVDCPPADTYDGFMIVNSSNPWMDKLYDTKPAFRRTLMERYTAYRYTLIEDMFAMIDEQAAYLSQVQAANYQLWPHRQFHTGVRNLRNWLTGRIEWLDSQWLVEPQTYEPGDVSMDGVVDSIDALLVLRYALGIAELGDGEAYADVNGDGAIGTTDALIILRYALGLIDSL